MIARAFFSVLLICLLALSAYGILTLPPQEKIFKTANMDRIEQTLRLEDPTRLRSFYGRLESKGDVDYLTFTIDKPASLRLSLKNPVGDDGFLPSMVVFGPGLPKLVTTPPVPIGETNGAVVAASVREKQRPVFEASELTTYLTGPTINTQLTEPGTYAITVYATGQEIGRYVLTIGDTPQTGFTEQLKRVPETVKVLLRLY